MPEIQEADSSKHWSHRNQEFVIVNHNRTNFVMTISDEEKHEQSRNPENESAKL